MINAIISIALFTSVMTANVCDVSNVMPTNNVSNAVGNSFTNLRDIHIIEKEPLYEEIEETEKKVPYIKEKKSLYERLTDEEIHLLEATIQNEVGAFSETYKTYIAELLYNRLQSDLYPDTVEEMLFQDGQFQAINYWYNEDTIINDDIKQIVKEVFTKEKPSHNATSYYNPALSTYSACIWFEYSGDVNFVFEYSETSYGIIYNTRFFSSAYE